MQRRKPPHSISFFFCKIDLFFNKMVLESIPWVVESAERMRKPMLAASAPVSTPNSATCYKLIKSKRTGQYDKMLVVTVSDPTFCATPGDLAFAAEKAACAHLMKRRQSQSIGKRLRQAIRTTFALNKQGSLDPLR